MFEGSIDGIFTKRIIAVRPVTMPQLENLFQTDVHASDVVSEITLFPSARTAALVLGGKGHTENDYASWLAQYRLAMKEPPVDMGEIVKVGQDAIARTVRDGKYEEKILSGKNPLRCEWGSRDCRIIWISIGIAPAELRNRFKNPSIRLFVRDRSVPTTEEALKISMQLQQRFHTRFLSVSFRSDEWFVEDLWFPVIYPFDERHSADLAKIRTAPEVVCTTDGGESHCGPIEMR